MKNASWASAFIFGLVCAANGGVKGFIGGMIIGYAAGAMLYVAAALLSLALRLALWACLFGVAAFLLTAQ
jgi:hypothetical protein